MNAKPLSNYLKTYRKRADLTQHELAFLLGVQSASKISRYENMKRLPTLPTVFAYEVIFGVPASQLFAGIYENSKEQVENKAIGLLHQWKNVSVPDHKIVLIHSIFNDPEILIQKLNKLDEA